MTVHEILVLIPNENSEGSDEYVHLRPFAAYNTKVGRCMRMPAKMHASSPI